MNILLWLWQLPQHLLGLFLIKILGAEKRNLAIYGRKITENGKEVFFWSYKETKNNRFLSGVSLGKYIILKLSKDDVNTVLHEYGHSKQSLKLGWLYLLVIGIYSALFCNLWDRLFHKTWSGQSRHGITLDGARLGRIVLAASTVKNIFI